MKWGVRRYQNPDGSLTAKGRKRYAKAIQKGLTLNERDYAYALGDIKRANKRMDSARSKLRTTPYKDWDKGLEDKKYKKYIEKYAKGKREAIAAKKLTKDLESDTWKLVAEAAKNNMTVSSKVAMAYIDRHAYRKARIAQFIAGPVGSFAYLSTAEKVPVNSWKVRVSKDGQPHIAPPAAGFSENIKKRK